MTELDEEFGLVADETLAWAEETLPVTAETWAGRVPGWIDESN